MEVKFTTSARKHRIGRRHALHVIAHAERIVLPPSDSLAERWLWIGVDDRGLELEVIAIPLEDVLLVIHVMPYRFRRR